MIWFLLGFLLIFLGLSVSIGPDGAILWFDTAGAMQGDLRSINLLPAFAGYLLFIVGCSVMGHENRRFRRLRIICIPLFLVTLAHFILEGFTDLLFGIPPLVRTVIHIVFPLVGLYAIYELTEAVKEMERSLDRPIGAGKLSTAWSLLCLGCLAYCFGLFYQPIYLLGVLFYALSVFWFTAAIFETQKSIKKRR